MSRPGYVDPASQNPEQEAMRHLMTRKPVGVYGRYLEGLHREGALIAGGKEALAEAVKAKGGNALEAMRTLGALLEGAGKKYLNVERPAADKPVAPLRAALRRFGFGEAKVGELYNELAAELAGLDGPTLLVALTRVLHRPEHLDLLGGPAKPVRPAPPAPAAPRGPDAMARTLAAVRSAF